MHYSQGHMEHIPGKNYMLGHKASLNTFEKTKIVSSMGLMQQQEGAEQVTGPLAPLGGGRAGSSNKAVVGVDRGSHWRRGLGGCPPAWWCSV